MVAQVDRLGALQMGISRHAPVPVSPREAQQAVHERHDELASALGPLAEVERKVRRHLVVPGAGCVEGAADRSD